MKKDEKVGSTGRTICTRSLAEKETPGLRRSTRGTPSTSTKLLTPTSSTRKSERLSPSPVSVTKKSGKMEKKPTPSPLSRSSKGKNVSSENSKGSPDKSGKNADISLVVVESKDKSVDNIQESTEKIKKEKPKMTGRSYRALYRGHLKKEANASSNDEEPLVVGCSRRVPAENEDARDGSCSPPANSESKRLPIGETSLEKGPDLPVKLTRDTENMVLDSPMVETGDDNVIDSPSENPEAQKLGVSKTSLETDIDLPLKRKRDNAGNVMDACGNADDRIMSSDGVTPSPSGCTNNNQPKNCGTCHKRQKVRDDFENLSVCSCPAQPVQESDHVAQDMKESRRATSRDYGESRQNMQQDKSHDPKLSSMYPEYWVPVQLSDVQIEQYCRTLLSNTLALSSLSKNLEVLEQTFTSARKTCDHPYVTDGYLKPLLAKNVELHEILDVEVKASGKLPLLGAMLTQIKTKGLKAVVFYQATQSPEGIPLANILEDFVSQRFGQDSYEHGVCHSKKNAINNFNKESKCFILLLETRACSQSIKLLRAEAFILFGSSLNPSHDVKLLEKIKIESYSERTKIFRLYSICTVEEKALILARENKPLENLNRPLIQTLLMWGASYLFDKLDHFHGSQALDSGVPLEQYTKDNMILEFSSILSSIVGEENEGKLCLLLEAKHAQGTYSTDSTLFGEKHVKLSDEVSPNIFWAKLLGGKNPKWKYCSDTSRRSRKRVQPLQGSEETAKAGNGGNTKKKKKASDDVRVDYHEIKASGKDHMGDLESLKVTTIESSRGSALGTNDAFNGNDAIGLYSMSGDISGIPEDMLAGIDWRQIPGESQKILHAVLKPEMAKLCQVLHLSEDSASMVEKFLEYIIENHRVCKEPATTLQAFQIALIWIAVSFVKQKCNHEESLVRAKSELGFNCSRKEVDYIYSVLHCMKSLFLWRTQGLQENINAKSMRSSNGEECMTEKRGSHYSSVTKDVEKTICVIKKKCSKNLQKLVQTHEEKKVELMNMNADKKQKLQTCKKVEASYIRVTCSGISKHSLHDALQRLEYTFERKFDDLKRELDECLESLEQMHEAAKKKLAEDEACWISRIEKWAQTELINRAPMQSGNKKHFSGLCSSNTSKNDPDVQTCNDASGEATNAETNCMVSKGNQVPEAENTLKTMSGGSTQQVPEMVASRNDMAMDVSTLSHEQPTENLAEHTSITAPDILIPAGCQEEFAALNVQLSEYQICDRVTSVTPDEDVPSRVLEISQSFANLPKSASLESSLNREEALVSIENDRTSHAGSDGDNILDQQNEEACSLDKEIPDELALPMPHPASVVKTRGSAESDQDHHEICPMLSSPGEKQPDPAENFQGQNIESAIEAQPAGSPMPSPDGKQPDPAANIQGKNIEAAVEPEPAESPMPSSPARQQSDPAADIQGKNIETTIEPQPAGSPMPSSPAGRQPDVAEKIQGNNIEAAIESQPAGSETVETGGFTALEKGDQVACPLPSSPAGNQPDPGANIEGQNIRTSAEPHIAGPVAVEIGASAVSDQEIMDAQDACSLPSPLAGTQADLAASTEGEIITAVLDAVETDNVSPLVHEGAVEPSAGVSDQEIMDAHDACSLPSPLAGTQADLAASTEGQIITAVLDAVETDNVSPLVHEGAVEPSAGVSDQQEIMDAQADLAASTEAQIITTVSDAVETDNVSPLVHEGAVVPSAGVTATVPSLLNNAMATGQNAMQPVPQIPFPMFNNPFQHELEKLRRESEITKKTYEEKKSVLRAEHERRMAELQAEYQRKFHEVEAENKAKTTKIEARKNLVIMNKLLATAFLSKCTSRISSHSSADPRGRIQQLAQRAAQVSALRSYPASAPAPLQAQASSVPRPLVLLNSSHCPMPQPRQPLISNTAPSLSASPASATNLAVNARLVSTAPHINTYRSSSPSTPIPTTTPTSSAVPQALTYSTALLQQQEQEHNLGSGLQRSNDVVCLSDDDE